MSRDSHPLPAPTVGGMAVENRVFFAAEATSQFFRSTVHGAFLSGVRAAYAIVLARRQGRPHEGRRGAAGRLRVSLVRFRSMTAP